MNRIFLLHCQKDDIMFLFQKNILATIITLPWEIYQLDERGGKNPLSQLSAWDEQDERFLSLHIRYQVKLVLPSSLNVTS